MTTGKALPAAPNPCCLPLHVATSGGLQRGTSLHLYPSFRVSFTSFFPQPGLPSQQLKLCQSHHLVPCAGS